MSSITSRRAVLIASAATIAGTAIAAVPLASAGAAPHPDAELLRLAREHEAA